VFGSKKATSNHTHAGQPKLVWRQVSAQKLYSNPTHNRWIAVTMPQPLDIEPPPAVDIAEHFHTTLMHRLSDPARRAVPNASLKHVTPFLHNTGLAAWAASRSISELIHLSAMTQPAPENGDTWLARLSQTWRLYCKVVLQDLTASPNDQVLLHIETDV
jgi:hypothetical protein